MSELCKLYELTDEHKTRLVQYHSIHPVKIDRDVLTGSYIAIAYSISHKRLVEEEMRGTLLEYIRSQYIMPDGSEVQEFVLDKYINKRQSIFGHKRGYGNVYGRG